MFVCVSLTDCPLTQTVQQLHCFLLSVWKHSEQLVEEITELLETTTTCFFLRIYTFSWSQWANCQSGWLLDYQIFISISINQCFTHIHLFVAVRHNINIGRHILILYCWSCVLGLKRHMYQNRNRDAQVHEPVSRCETAESRHKFLSRSSPMTTISSPFHTETTH